MSDMNDWEASDGALELSPIVPGDPNWEHRLQRKKTQILPTLPNAVLILSEHPALRRVMREDGTEARCLWIGFNEFHWCKMKLRDLPWGEEYGRWQDVDTALVREWLGQYTAFSTDVVQQAVSIVAHRNRFHEVKRGLESLAPWDGVDRVSDFLARYFGTDDNEYTRAVGRAWIISAVARAMEPGCKADCMLILEGDQGDFKSTAFEELAGKQFYADDKIDFNDAKEAMSSLEGSWIRELSELEGMNKAAVTTVKAFVSKKTDRYRPAYGHEMIVRPRSLVFCATTNEHEYLDDGSGGRRFWPTRVTNPPCRWMAIREDRKQIWAQVLELYRRGESWHLKPGTAAAMMALHEQAERKKGDPIEHPIARWVTTVGQERAEQGKGISTHDVLSEALKIPYSQMDRSWETRVGNVLRSLGWKTYRLTPRVSKLAQTSGLPPLATGRRRLYFPGNHLLSVDALRSEIQRIMPYVPCDEGLREQMLLKAEDDWSVVSLGQYLDRARQRISEAPPSTYDESGMFDHIEGDVGESTDDPTDDDNVG